MLKQEWGFDGILVTDYDNVGRLVYEQRVAPSLVESELFLPWSAQQLRGELFASCEVLEDRAEDEGAYFRVRGDPKVVEAFSESHLRQMIGYLAIAEVHHPTLLNAS